MLGFAYSCIAAGYLTNARACVHEERARCVIAANSQRYQRMCTEDLGVDVEGSEVLRRFTEVCTWKIAKFLRLTERLCRRIPQCTVEFSILGKKYSYGDEVRKDTCCRQWSYCLTVC